MKKILTLICTLLCANMLLAFGVDSLYYEVTSTNPPEVKVYDANSSITTANIPATVSYNGNTYSVTSIGYQAFFGCSSLTSVTIPNSVTSIGGRAFGSCGSLTFVTIPNSVTSIGGGVFHSCSSLTSVTLSNNITELPCYHEYGDVHYGFFDGCSSLISITIPNSVTSIGWWAFQGCSSLTSVTIPNSITSIEAGAFSGCSSLTSVTCLRSNSPSLGSNVFYGTPNNKTLTIPCGCESEYTDWQNATTWASIDCIVTIGNLFTIGDLTYEVTSETELKVQDCTQSATSVVIPETVTYQGTTYSVTSIGNDAFGWCSSLTSVVIPNSVTSIGNSAFRGCSSLTSVTIPNSVTSIGNNAFQDCSSLTSIDIPNSVTSIGNDAFYNCSSLTSVTIPNSVTSIGDAAFAFCSSLTSITIPNSVTSIGWGAFGLCSSLTSVTIPNSVTSIGEAAFGYCSSLTSITIPNSVTSIGGAAFYGCSSLTSITIPNSVTSIGVAAFYGCSSLTSVTLSNNITELPFDYESGYSYGIFEDCSSLTSITIPNSVTYIGNRAFYGCSSLTSMTVDMTYIPNLSYIGLNSTLQNLTIGENVTSIASGAFNSYSFLQNITCLATTPPTLEDNTVFPYPNIASLNVPCGSLEDYSAPTSYWNVFFAGRISENGYNVEVSVNDETFGSVAVESDCSTGTLTATANEGYRFVIWNDGNTDNPRTVALTSDTSFTAIFALIDNSSLSEDAEFAELSVYPNPTRGKVTFNQAIEKVEVIDLSGKTLQTYENVNEINIESLPAGVYHLRMTIGDKTTTRKIIKE